MRIKITKGGIFGADGEIPVGTELTVKDEPTGWAGRYEVIGSTNGKTAVNNEPETGIEKMTVAELKAFLKANKVEIPADAKKDDLLALARKVGNSE